MKRDNRKRHQRKAVAPFPKDPGVVGRSTISVELRLPGMDIHEVTLDPSMTAAQFVATCVEHFGLHRPSWHVLLESGAKVIHLDDQAVIAEALRTLPGARLCFYPEVAGG